MQGQAGDLAVEVAAELLGQAGGQQGVRADHQTGPAQAGQQLGTGLVWDAQSGGFPQYPLFAAGAVEQGEQLGEFGHRELQHHGPRGIGAELEVVRVAPQWAQSGQQGGAAHGSAECHAPTAERRALSTGTGRIHWVVHRETPSYPQGGVISVG